MAQSPYLSRVQSEMRPGVITQDGFLGNDHRELQEILIEDDATVKRLNTTHAAIAARMHELMEAGAEGLGLPIDVPPHFEIQVDSVRGKLPCPFMGGTIVQKLNTTVFNTRLGREITYTDLNIHMIEEHGFYEGRGSLFRMPPEELAEILEMDLREPPPEDEEGATPRLCVRKDDHDF
ncbi:MAG: hypothetical protein HQ523_06720 [Lentisphaerae bacterium]|nr:hypothetical protein [Lentisphaerota bacterium]